jgi:LEA14-like dessication related protein
MKWSVLAMLLTTLVVGCIPKVQQPEVWLGGARLASIGLSGGVVEVQLSVYNPNRFALRASGLTYDVDLEDSSGDGWIDFTEGELDRDVEVPAGDTAMVAIPVEFDYRSLGQALRGILERGTFDYRVSGRVALEDPIRRSFSYRHAGAVSPSGAR